MTVKRRENRKDATSGLQVRFKNGDYFENAVEFYFNKEASKLIGFKVISKSIPILLCLWARAITFLCPLTCTILTFFCCYKICYDSWLASNHDNPVNFSKKSSVVKIMSVQLIFQKKLIRVTIEKFGTRWSENWMLDIFIMYNYKLSWFYMPKKS